MERHDLVYRISADDFSGEVDARELGGIILSFADAVQSTVSVLGCDDRVTVNVKPFEEGSFLMDFVISSGGLLGTLFASDGATALSNALTILGFVGDKARSLPSVVRATGGNVALFTDNEDGTYTYGDGADSVTVGENVHRVVQSPAVARAYTNAMVRPILNIDRSTHITVQGRGSYVAGDVTAGQTFSYGDYEEFQRYDETVSDEEANITPVGFFTLENAVLHPLSGSYNGSAKGYRFDMDGKHIQGVEIQCPDLIEQLASGAIRFTGRDTLVCTMSYEQFIDRNGEARQRNWKIVELKNYYRYEPPHQTTIGEFLD